MVTLSGASAMVFRTHSRQLESVSPIMPAMRSMLTCGNPIESHEFIRAVDLLAPWARPFASRIA